jgi:predicted phosphoribosyltransferase
MARRLRPVRRRGTRAAGLRDRPERPVRATISNGGPTLPFKDRSDAGRQLAAQLERYAGEAVVLALPRGGVVVGYEVARALGAPLDVVVARKLGAPHQPELGIGAVAGGVRVLDEQALRAFSIPREYVEDVTARELAEAHRRERLYRGDRPALALEGRTALLVDDGLATGVTARAAIAATRLRAPSHLVLAVPVCAAHTAAALRPQVEALVCLESPPEFYAVGLWYDDFRQTPDEEVQRLLELARRQTITPPTHQGG